MVRIGLLAVLAALLAGALWFLGRGGEPGSGRSADGESEEKPPAGEQPVEVEARRLPEAEGHADPGAEGRPSPNVAEPASAETAVSGARLTLRVVDAQTRMDLLDVLSVTGAGLDVGSWGHHDARCDVCGDPGGCGCWDGG